MRDIDFEATEVLWMVNFEAGLALAFGEDLNAQVSISEYISVSFIQHSYYSN